MNKKRLWLVIIGFILVFNLSWYGLSFIITHRSPPDEKAISDFRKAHESLLKFDSVKGILEEAYLDANGYRLHMDILAHGKGRPTMVFIPGTSVYAEIYMGFLHAMYKEGFNVVGFDPRGHGRSSGPRGDYTMNGVVDDALSVCDYAKKRFNSKIVVAGSSQGGMAAFYAAAKDDSIAAAVCHNIADLNGRDNLVLSQVKIPPFLVPLAHLSMSVYRNFAFPTSLYLDLKHEYLPNGQDAASFLKKDPLAITWITFRALDSLMETPLAKPVEKITVPVMVIHSDKDHIFPQAYVENLYSRLTCKKEYLLLKDREHLIMTNNVDEVSPKVAIWLKNILENPSCLLF